ncbi:MAG: hypothetical protein AAF936_12930 [Pseudomonadota bacterium]
MPIYRRVTDRNIPEANNLFVVVGQACTAWANVELGLISLFDCIVTSIPPKGSMVAFGSLVSLNVRMTQLRSVYQAYFLSGLTNPDTPEDERLKQYDDFSIIFRRIESANGLRNKIVHGSVTEIESQDGQKHYRVCPPFFTQKNQNRRARNPSGPLLEYEMDEAEIVRYVNYFESLSDYLLKVSSNFRFQQDAFFDKAILRNIPSL